MMDFVLAYHGCSEDTAEKICLRKDDFILSENKYDWLGKGAYFWENDPHRAKHFIMNESKKYKKSEDHASVLGVVINLGKCLDLTLSKPREILKKGYEHLSDLKKKYKKNNEDGARYLDYQVIEAIHKINEDFSEGSFHYDTVRAAFEEGDSVYPGAKIKDKTHVQICVRNIKAIHGIFLVTDDDMKEKYGVL